jgi:hypothetical protein
MQELQVSAAASPTVIEKLVSFHNDIGGGLIVKHEQHIPDEFISSLRREREDSLSTPAGEYHRVASIPTAIVDKWLKEGFDIYRETVQEILKRLRKEQLDGFITSNKVH